jgi:multicomponent K+:H+ antiporter subunit E
MRRLMPSPWLSLGLLIGWVLLTRSFSLGQFLLGSLLAIVLPLIMSALRPTPGPLRRWGLLIRLILRVGKDVIISAVQVAAGVWQSQARAPCGAFVVVPLELRDPHALAALAMISAVVPGTVWSELAADHSAVMIHVFDVPDEAAFIHHFKSDYEQPLKEIFE